MKDWIDALTNLDWRLLIPQPLVTTIGFLINNYSKVLGAIVLVMQIIYLSIAINEKLRRK